MKTFTRQTLLLASFAVLALPAVVQAQFKCKTNSDSTITITGYIGEPVLPSGALTIPSMINGLPVTGIGSYSFEYCYSLTQCTLPDSVTNIADSAFYGTGIASITIPANVIYIGKDAFFYCNSLANISVNPSNSAYSSLNGVLLSKDQTTLVEYPNGISGSYLIPSSVTSIGRYAFDGCCLKSVTMPNSVTSIGNWAFDACTSLTNAPIPGSVTSIGDYAFRCCSGLPSVVIPAGVTSIGNWAFETCTSLTSVSIPASVTSIGKSAFGGYCTSLTNISVSAANSIYCGLNGVLLSKDQTTLIQFPGGFSGKYVIPSCVINIEDYAFSTCTYLTSVSIPTSVTHIGNGTFEACTGLTSVSIPASVTSIGQSVFEGCSLISVTLPSSVSNIGLYAFANCFSMSNVYFTGSAPSLGSFVFSGDTKTAIYYLPGTIGWDTCGYSPAVLWNPQVQYDANFGVQANGFGFTFTNAGSPTVVVEACTDLTSGVWIPVSTNTLTGGSSYFGDSCWTNYPARFYRFQMP